MLSVLHTVNTTHSFSTTCVVLPRGCSIGRPMWACICQLIPVLCRYSGLYSIYQHARSQKVKAVLLMASSCLWDYIFVGAAKWLYSSTAAQLHALKP